MSGLSTPTPISVLFAGRMRLLHVVDIHKHSLLVDCLLVTALLGCVIAKLMHLSRRGTGKGRPSIPHISGIPFVGSLAFFTRRHRFILDCMTRHGPMFSFNVASHKVTVISGEGARKFFFGSRDVGFSEGYRILFGNIPSLQSIHVQEEEDRPSRVWFLKRLNLFQNRDYLSKVIPHWLNDLDRSMRTWGDQGQLDPFDKIYSLVFQLEMRMAGCREIADDPEATQRFQKLYWTIERGGLASVMFPWLPLPSRILKFRATVKLYLTLKDIIESRRKTGRTEDDAMQVLLDKGDGPYEIVHFVMSLLYAGIFSTGITICWLPLFLQANPEWKDKVFAEITTLLDTHAPDHSEPLTTRLTRIPVHAWETGTPAFDACLLETIRICLSGTFLRRALVDGLSVNGQPLEKGVFIAYPVADVNQNPRLYPDPERWDPTRFERGEGKEEQWSFLGFGAGHHTCAGRNLGTMVNRIILSSFLLTFDYQIVNEKGSEVYTLPPPNRDDAHKSPPIRPVYIQYRRKIQ